MPTKIDRLSPAVVGVMALGGLLLFATQWRSGSPDPAAVARADQPQVDILPPDESTDFAAPLLVLPADESAETVTLFNLGTVERPIATLDPVPLELDADPIVRLAPLSDWASPDDVGFQIYAETRYAGPEHALTLTVARPSPAAEVEGFRFSGVEVAAPDGGRRWIEAASPNEHPSVVVTRHGAWIVTLTSTLPIEQAASLADRVRIEIQGRPLSRR